MNLRDKFLNFKRRLSDRRMYSIVIVIIGVISIFGIYQYKCSANLRQELDNQYNRAFFDMVGHVNNAECLIAKSLIASTSTKTASYLQESYRQANLAQTNLGQLPVSQPVLANTSKFLVQLGDFAYSLNNQNMSGNSLTDDQYKIIEKLHGFAASLNNSLIALENQIVSGRIKWKDLSNKGTPLFAKTSATLSASQFDSVEKNFQEVPKLIYDGPFSEHISTTEPKGLVGNQISEEQGKEKIKNFLSKDKIKEIKYTGKTDQNLIKTFSYSVIFGNLPNNNVINIDLTQKGGMILWMISDRHIESKTHVNIEQARSISKKFLEDRGYKSMRETYYLKEDNTAIINYAYQEKNVIVYPDLIKVKIALDNGEVIGFESTGYMYSHTIRNIPKPRVLLSDAKSKINKRVNITSSALAIIPTNYKTEIFTYEFKGNLNNKDFLIYINALTGKEENVLMLLNTPNGIFTL